MASYILGKDSSATENSLAFNRAHTITSYYIMHYCTVGMMYYRYSITYLYPKKT